MEARDQYKGKYKQIQMIGKGNYGTIYRIKSLTDGKDYVAKHIPLGNIQENVAEKELEIIKKLKHPYIVEYIDSFKSNEDFIIVMQYCKQRDLDHHIQLMKSNNKYFNENLIVTWLFQLVLGIQFIHSKKILHRDIKPQNIFIDQKLNIKIGDFGISKILTSTGQQCQTMLGTPYYLAPQIISQQLYTTKADIWSLGCVIYEICALQKPFQAKGGLLQLMEFIKVAQIKEIPRIYSEDLRKLVMKMMTRDQSKRLNTTQLLKDPVLVDLMIKNSSSMSLKKQYSKNIEKPSTLSDSFINKQTNLVHEQLRKFQQQVSQKMQNLKKKEVNTLQVDQQYMELKKKMTQIQNAIGKAFNQLKKKASGQNIASKQLQKSLKSNSSLTDSSEMTIVESVVWGQKDQSKKSSKIIAESASYQSVPIIETKKGIDFSNNSSMISAESVMMRESDKLGNSQSLKLSSKVLNKKMEDSMDQTLLSQYQKTHKSNTLARQTMEKLDFLQKAISRNPDSVLNGSLLSFTLTMSQDEIKRSMDKQRSAGKGNPTNSLSMKLKSEGNLDQTLNFDLTKRSCDQSQRVQKAFMKKKQKSEQKQPQAIIQVPKITQATDQDQQYYNDDFQQYQQDFQSQEDDDSLQCSGVKQIKERRRSEMNTIRSFYQQTLLQINNQSEMTETQKVKNKYPLVMSQIEEQNGEAGSILSKNNTSGNSNSSVRM